MSDPPSPDTPVETAAEASGSETAAGLKKLGNEARLGILLALWEVHTPFDADNTCSFSELYDRVGVNDSGNFTYHLDQLTGQYVKERDDGYELTDTGLNVVQAVISGTGLETERLPQTELDVACTRCGAPTAISYSDGYADHFCTSCDGNFGDAFGDDYPAGLLASRPLPPAGLAHRSGEEVFAASHVRSIVSISSFVRGVCPTCSGAVDESIEVCETHNTEAGGLCSACGTRDEVRVRYVCSVCKDAGSYPVGAATYGLPAVEAFLHDQGLGVREAVSDPESCTRVLERDRKKRHAVESWDPLRVRVTVPGRGADLHVRFNEDLDVVDVTRDGRSGT